MQVRVTKMDIPRTRASWPDTEFTPAYVAPRSDAYDWWIADTSVPITGVNVAVGWAIANTDEYIRIPLFSYDLSPQADLALSVMFKMGIIAANAFNGKVRVLHMVVGSPAELVYLPDGSPASINYWFGFALSQG